ncbi:MAG: hypothetical protein SGI99_09200 [Pseudomonadota bacterium]|nr:hypothetical protein [Pseudomonadota bacterium]
MKHRIVFAAMLAASAVASAQTAETAVRRDHLKGMTQVADGLYVRKSADRESYFATSAAGRAAIAEKMRKVNAEFARHYAKDGISLQEQELLTRSEQTQRRLRQAASLSKDTVTGGCGNGAYLVATAYASYGNSAGASAVNAVDFGPATPTTNVAWARAGWDQDYSVEIGTTQATASVYNYSSCLSEATGEVFCPSGYAGGTGTAYEISVDAYGNCQIP